MTWTPLSDHVPMTRDGVDGLRRYGEKHRLTKRDANEWVVVLCDEIKRMEHEYQVLIQNRDDLYCDVQRQKRVIEYMGKQGKLRPPGLALLASLYSTHDLLRHAFEHKVIADGDGIAAMLYANLSAMDEAIQQNGINRDNAPMPPFQTRQDTRARIQTIVERRFRELLAEIRPMAAWESCMYTNRHNAYQRSIGVEPEFADDDPDIDSTTHCCDWNEVVERIDQVLQWKLGS